MENPFEIEVIDSTATLTTAIQISFELRLKVFTHDLNSAFGRASDDCDSLQYVINASVMNGCHKSSITCMKRKSRIPL